MSARQISMAGAMCVLTAILSGCNSARMDAGGSAIQYTTSASRQVTIDRLAEAMPFTFDALHWGQMYVRNEVTGLSAAALTEDGRRADVVAEKAPDGSIALQIRVGHFGDDQLERHFFEELDRQMRSFQ